MTSMALAQPTSDQPASPDGQDALRVATIDGDSGFLVVLAKRLQRVDWEHSMLPLTTSAAKAARLDVDVLTIDAQSLDADPWAWLGRLCDGEPDFRIVVCTGASTVAERVRALRIGVDDWLSKPCHPEELIARVESVADRRRKPPPRNLEPVIVGEVEVRPDQYQAFVRGESLKLTRREFQLIELLCSAGGEILEREVIYERLWGYEMARNDRSVDVFVHKLRRKLQLASPQWSYIHTQFRVGYRIAAVPEPAEPLPVELRPEPELPVPLAA
jgi:DNA-binding response OmpR family regulator